MGIGSAPGYTANAPWPAKDNSLLDAERGCTRQEFPGRSPIGQQA
jgi:hypothetical protein